MVPYEVKPRRRHKGGKLAEKFKRFEDDVGGSVAPAVLQAIEQPTGCDDFDPWENLRWKTVRVIYYRQHKADGTIVEAYWLTDFSKKQAGSRAIFGMAKSRWQIENQGFNDAKNRYGFEHVCHHHPNSLLINWLITVLTLTLERLYRIRHLHRGKHPVLEPIALLRLLRLSLLEPADTS